MICKKCKTAIPNDARVCPNCGAKARSWKAAAFNAGLAIVLVAAAAAAAYNIYEQRVPVVDKAPETRAAEITEQPIPRGDAPAPAPRKGADTSTESPAPTPSEDAAEREQPDLSGDLTKSAEEVSALLKTAAKAAQRYLDERSGTDDLVCRGGFLYDYGARAYVTPETLSGAGYLAGDCADENAVILYVNPSDVIDGERKGLTVFAAYETAEGYDLAAANGDVVPLTKERFDALLGAYSVEDGQAALITAKNDAFGLTLEAVNKHLGREYTYDVRSMTGDGGYILAVVSPKESPMFIWEFIVENRDGEYAVVVDKIETQTRKLVYINMAAPNVNLRMIPAYNLAKERESLRADFSAILGAMRSSGLIADIDGEPSFISGNGEFVYMEFSTGLHYLANCDNELNEWKMYLLMSYQDALTRMEELSKNGSPPYYLVKQG